MRINKRLIELGIELPEFPQPAAAYVPGLLINNLIFVSGQTPKKGTQLLFKGKLGRDLSIEQGQEAARICILRALSVVENEIGNLDFIEQIVKLTGYVNCTDDFEQQAKVIDGASLLLQEIFGKVGRHTRVAVGMNSLPGNAAVEIEIIVKIKE